MGAPHILCVLLTFGSFNATRAMRLNLMPANAFRGHSGAYNAKIVDMEPHLRDFRNWPDLCGGGMLTAAQMGVHWCVWPRTEWENGVDLCRHNNLTHLTIKRTGHLTSRPPPMVAVVTLKCQTRHTNSMQRCHSNALDVYRAWGELNKVERPLVRLLVAQKKTPDFEIVRGMWSQ